MLSHNKCLLLNADYTPLYIIGWKRAMVWSVKYSKNTKNSIDIIDFYKNDYINGANNKKYPIPAVAKTFTFFPIHRYRVNFSRQNLFLRDNFTCQYCGDKFQYNLLTYDHIIPKSSWNYFNGSPTNWTNIVTSCISCNRLKGNRTPKQANMILKRLPFEPNKSAKYLTVTQHLSKIKDNIPDEWKIYLPESYFIN